MKFSLRKKITKLFLYEISLLTLAFGIVFFDVIYIAGNRKPISMHHQQSASLSPVTDSGAAFTKSCEGIDMASEDLKSVVQRGFCSLYSSTK